MTVYWIAGISKDLELYLDWSQKDREGEYVFEWHRSPIEVAWRGHIISIYDRGYGVGKGHTRYEVYVDGKRERGTDICWKMRIEWDGDSAPRKLWNRYKREC